MESSKARDAAEKNGMYTMRRPDHNQAESDRINTQVVLMAMLVRFGSIGPFAAQKSPVASTGAVEGALKYLALDRGRQEAVEQAEAEAVALKEGGAL